MLAFYMSLVDEEDERQKFEYVYEKYKKKMWYTANRVLHDEFLAEDAVHNAFIGIAKNIGKIGDADSKLTLAYVTSAARNAAVNLLKKNKHGEMIDIDSLWNIQDSKAQETFRLSEEMSQAVQILTKMSAIYRDVLYYHFVEDMSEKEISALLSRNVNTVHQQLQRGKQIFREKMKKENAANGTV